MEKSLILVMQRHEILRTSFDYQQDGFYQIIHDDVQLISESRNISNLNQAEREKLIDEVIKHPFDFKQIPIRYNLFELADEQAMIVLTLHHVLTDMFSNLILLKEWMNAYNQLYRGEKSDFILSGLQYVDFSQWQRKIFRGDFLEEKKQYWANYLKGFKGFQYQWMRGFTRVRLL